MLNQLHFPQPSTISAQPKRKPKRSVPSRSTMEARRLAAAIQLRDGVSQSQVAREFGVSRTTAGRWVDAIRRGDSLVRRKAPGRPTGLTHAQIERLKAEYCANRWNFREFMEVIHLLTDVRYDEDHVGRLVYKWGLKEKRGKRKAAVA